MSVRKKRIQTMVTELLNDHHVSKPPIPIERIARSLGLLIRFEPLDSDLSGFLYRDGDQGVVGVNSSHPKTRKRFTIAHEIGHFLLHQAEKFHVDRQVFVRFRDNLSSQGIDEEEMEANLFAAEILMPRSSIHEDVQKLTSIDILHDERIESMARNYGVSLQALMVRLTGLGYIEH